MQFVARGPDIPNTLLQAHEEERVVFFCGAGISYPAGLPGFKGLVDKIYQSVGTELNPIEQVAYRLNQFDATLDLLERRLPGGRIAVRNALAQILQPKLRRHRATDTHAALLQLARSRKGDLRLVTTNFDRVFEHVAKRTKQVFSSYAAPMLPIPKSSRWNGLVYLHGLLPDNLDGSALQRLVLTSGDFGLAYLTERWAARFVSELFRNYVVCFVGYSINDPVLRYMMDALAADRMLGENTPQAYALGDCNSENRQNKIIEWEAKGVTPILYEVPVGGHDHSALHKTLRAWAETYCDGTTGRERIVVNFALARPSASTSEDDFVGRMLWALSHESGLPAKRFAEFNPVPSLEWLEAFSADRYRYGDLIRFGVPPQSKTDDELQFSLLRRPSPYTLAPWMMIVSGGAIANQFDSVMHHLSRWMLRHLNDPTLIIWFAQRGGQLHDRLSRLMDDELGRFARLEREGNTAELDEIRNHAPNAIPDPLMQVLWRLMLTGRVKSPWQNTDLFRWKARVKRDGLTATLRIELRELLAPKVVLKQPFRWGDDDEHAEDAEHIKQSVDCELVLTANHAHSTLRDLTTDETWRTALPKLLDDFQQLLRDALDLLRELGDADDHSDQSLWDLPSITPHWQNRASRDWVTLIELLRDSWLATRVNNPERATIIAKEWFVSPYPAFKRLALFAASQDDCIASDQWVEWLVGDDARWLWSTETRRETMRLLVLQSKSLSAKARIELEAAILAGPPRSMFKDDLEPGRLLSLVDGWTWLRLAKLRHGAGHLDDATSQHFNSLSESNPEWKLASNESDEFSVWMSGTGDPDYDQNRQVDIAPRKRRDLVDWLKRPPPERRPMNEDTWSEICRRHPANVGYALADLAQQGIWPRDRWSDAFYAWSEKGRPRKTWQCFASVVQTMPESDLKKLAQSVAWWLKAVAGQIDTHESIFLDLCRRLLDLPLNRHTGIIRNGEPIDHAFSEALNHPVGYVTQALLNLWFKRVPNDNDSLSGDIKPFFTQLCNTDIAQYRHGRVLLASNLIALFRVDRSWTEANLLPLFDWTRNAVEAKAAWEGFFSSPRGYQPLLIAFKQHFLATAHHYADLKETHRQFAAFLTFTALESVDGYTPEDFRTAVAALPQDGLHEVVQALCQALEGAGEQREEYWKNRIQPFWHQVWPKTKDLASSNIAESVARLSIAARREFPAALSAILAWLKPIEHPYYLVHLLQESGLAGMFPREALSFLNAVLDEQPFAPQDIKQCLDAISTTAPKLAEDARFVRLTDYFQKHGI